MYYQYENKTNPPSNQPSREVYEQNAALREVLDFIGSGALANGDAKLFRPLVDNLLWSDPFLVLADYQTYVACQEQVSARWRDPEAWTRQSILTVAPMGRFSSDRAIREYADHIWGVQPLPVANPPTKPKVAKRAQRVVS